jgi:hypothetical protein
MRFFNTEENRPLRGTAEPIVKRPIVSDQNQVFCRSIGCDFRIVQLPQALLISAPRMEAGAFKKFSNFYSYVVINEKLERRSPDGRAVPAPIPCLSGHRPKTCSRSCRASHRSPLLFERYGRVNIFAG